MEGGCTMPTVNVNICPEIINWALSQTQYLLSGSLEKVQSENNTGLIVFDSQNNIEAGNVIIILL